MWQNVKTNYYLQNMQYEVNLMNHNLEKTVETQIEPHDSHLAPWALFYIPSNRKDDENIFF